MWLNRCYSADRYFSPFSGAGLFSRNSPWLLIRLLLMLLTLVFTLVRTTEPCAACNGVVVLADPHLTLLWPACCARCS
jgi:hypothetical protein